MLRVTQATTDEAPLVYSIMVESLEEYRGVLKPPSGVFRETPADVRAAMAKGGAFLAWWGVLLTGSARYRFERDHVYVGRVSVLPAYRGRGVATALMQAIEPRAQAAGFRRLRLGVRLILDSNIRLYERLGYLVVSVQEHEKGGRWWCSWRSGCSAGLFRGSARRALCF
ncbi:MAG: GNAT family N-acetyltransferase [Anaerolineae bacterium]